jgi:aminoglycoside phosphotransferase (APT) family kinase protein
VPLCPAAAGRIDLDGIAAAGRALAALHAAPLRLVRDGPGEPPGKTLAAIAAMLGRLLPDLASQAGHLATRIAAALDAAPARPRLIHGDFSADQVIWDGSRARIIDWDEVRDGDPAADFGAFRARLEAQVLDGRITDSEAGHAQEALVAGYAERAEPPAALAAQAAAALLKLTVEGFRARRPDWPARAEALLARAEAALDGPAPFAATLARALSRAGAEGPLAAAGVLRPCDRPRLLRLKPGRRALVAYRLGGPDGGTEALGKLRSRGLDSRTARLTAALRARGFDEAAADGIATPALLGEVPALGMWLQARVAGRPATELLRPGADGAAAARVGAALAKLHRLGPPAGRQWTLGDELAALDRSLAAAAAGLPSLETRPLAAAARALAATMPVGASGPVHRDFHPDQALIDGARVWLVDLDLYAMADPALDAGNFAAHLIETALREHGDAAALDGHVSRFLAAWSESGPPGAPARVPAWTALALARCAAIAAARPSRRAAAPALATRALARLAALGAMAPRRLSA